LALDRGRTLPLGGALGAETGYVYLALYQDGRN
jgi:hypothetical protein